MSQRRVQRPPGRWRRRICIVNPMQNGQWGAETGLPQSGPAGGPRGWNRSRPKFYAFIRGHRRHTHKSKLNTYGGQAGSRAPLGRSCTSCTDRRQVEIAFCLIPFQTIPPAERTSLRHDSLRLCSAGSYDPVGRRSSVAPCLIWGVELGLETCSSGLGPGHPPKLSRAAGPRHSGPKSHREEYDFPLRGQGPPVDNICGNHTLTGRGTC